MIWRNEGCDISSFFFNEPSMEKIELNSVLVPTHVHFALQNLNITLSKMQKQRLNIFCDLGWEFPHSTGHSSQCC